MVAVLAHPESTTAPNSIQVDRRIILFTPLFSFRSCWSDRRRNQRAPDDTGEGVLQDDAEAVRWYRLAADQGHADAQFKLGGMHADGRGVLKDAAEAVRWYRLAADQGDASAQHKLGVMHTDGRGVLKDSVLAHMWLNIAGANGDEGARENRDTLERDMTRAEISRATKLARECMDSDYQDCAP